MINDWREFKRLESEKKEEQEREKQALLKKLSITCRSHVSLQSLFSLIGNHYT